VADNGSVDSTPVTPQAEPDAVAIAVSVPADAPSADAPPAVAIATAQAQTKVRIETPGATVEVEASESLDTVAAVALRLFREAGGWPKEETRSAGFAHAERRDTPPTQASSMPWAPGAYPVQTP
jgi:hypothetical protein